MKSQVLHKEVCTHDKLAGQIISGGILLSVFPLSAVCFIKESQETKGLYSKKTESKEIYQSNIGYVGTTLA